jgi:hypothetical protein
VAGLHLIINVVNQIASWFVISSGLAPHGLASYGFTFLAVEVPLVVAIWILVIYLALLFPALAIDEPVAGARARISASMSRMRGHFWQFVGAILLTCAPVTVIGAVISFALVRRMMEPVLLGSGRHGVWFPQLQNPWFYTSVFLGAFTAVLTVALAASVASWLYASLGPKRGDA